MLYAVKKDAECAGLVVVFGTAGGIADDELNGDAYEEEPAAYDEVVALQGELLDTGELCEDYLIVSERFTDEGQIPEVKAIVEAHGFVEDTALLGCGWG